VEEHGFCSLWKMLYGREDLSGHDFSRAAKLLKINNSTLPKASAYPAKREERTEKRFSAHGFSQAVRT
jgi:hypothetical protein